MKKCTEPVSSLLFMVMVLAVLMGNVTWAGFGNPQFEYPQEKLKDKVIQIKDEQKI